MNSSTRPKIRYKKSLKIIIVALLTHSSLLACYFMALTLFGTNYFTSSPFMASYFVALTFFGTSSFAVVGTVLFKNTAVPVLGTLLKLYQGTGTVLKSTAVPVFGTFE